MEEVLSSCEVTENTTVEEITLSNQNVIELFLSAKKIEYCMLNFLIINFVL